MCSHHQVHLSITAPTTMLAGTQWVFSKWMNEWVTNRWGMKMILILYKRLLLSWPSWAVLSWFLYILLEKAYNTLTFPLKASPGGPCYVNKNFQFCLETKVYICHPYETKWKMLSLITAVRINLELSPLCFLGSVDCSFLEPMFLSDSMLRRNISLSQEQKED